MQATFLRWAVVLKYYINVDASIATKYNQKGLKLLNNIPTTIKHAVGVKTKWIKLFSI